MDSFSWSDALRACLPCLARPAIELDDELDDEQQQQQASRAPRASLSAREELERLLETDDEAETLSLHSNLGGQRRAKKRGRGKHISLFGFSLFGRRTGGIALADSDDEEAGAPRRAHPRRSSSTLDSDAAPIDDSAIENLSWDAAREAEERERAERRAARRHRKEMKRAAAALAAGVGEDEFEGFPGSGAYLPPAHSQDFGAFVQAPTPPPSEPPYQQPQHAQVSSNDDDEADFGAELYTRKTGSSVRSGSDARSSSSGGRRKKSAKSSTSASSRRSADELRSPPAAAAHFADVAVASPSPPPHLQQAFAHPGQTPSPKTTTFPSTGFGRPSGGARGLSAASFSAALGRSGNDA
ncbi:hypothetical protein AURDEDRAFT_112057 [Auricularia subglabra TFB-10046 SS5]|nr:hypothetical protein AURDEDRAFT_112057 [Auricularia subglabra TFB-10046 SS5]